MPTSANPQPTLPAPSSGQAGDGLNVIALVSGGKDSFFSLLHCLANGHRVVALANLHPQVQVPVPGTQGRRSGDPAGAATPSAATVPSASAGASTATTIAAREEHGQSDGEAAEDQDLNSFMFQTVGHQVIPLYAEATGIPLYRQPIIGGAAQSGKDYAYHEPASGTSRDSQGPEPAGAGELEASQAGPQAGSSATATTPVAELQDETESMVPLLRAVMAAHPEANALSAGAILSTYQRTRVESVATRLGLTPLAYLWKFPALPQGAEPSAPARGSSSALPSIPDEPLADAQLLRDMAAVGLDARLVKVATGGLDESFLWTNLATTPGMARVARGMRRFTAAEPGAVLGEGGEFETLVIDGPRVLFRKRVVVEEPDRLLVREGGNNSWLRIRAARVVEKGEPDAADADASAELPRQPPLLDARFGDVLKSLSDGDGALGGVRAEPSDRVAPSEAAIPKLSGLHMASNLAQWCVVGDASARASIELETASLVDTIRGLLRRASLEPSAIIATAIILRRMADFPKINQIYGGLFTEPNPPSRVTISCGAQLPEGCNIVIYLTVHPSLLPGQRKGLHVQSRSYWAPANIGPYSQAISLPLELLASNSRETSGPELVNIAGQIPLIPASMQFPAGLDTLQLEIVLSLQHLWRIGLDVGVQWWSSAVAFFPRCGPAAMSDKARGAGLAWETAHRWSPSRESPDDGSDNSEDDGPDLWDRHYNAAYVSFGTEDDAAPPSLPDWSVVAGATEDDTKPVPPFFAAEVEELPRSAGVEWQAHGGLAKLAGASVRCSHSVAAGGGGVEVSTMVVESSTGVTLVHQTCSLTMREATKHRQQDPSGKPVPLAQALGGLPDHESSGWAPVVQYFDSSVFRMPTYEPSEAASTVPAVPCFSLWNGHGEPLGLVLVRKQVLYDQSKVTSAGDDE